MRQTVAQERAHISTFSLEHCSIWILQLTDGFSLFSLHFTYLLVTGIQHTTGTKVVLLTSGIKYKMITISHYDCTVSSKLQKRRKPNWHTSLYYFYMMTGTSYLASPGLTISYLKFWLVTVDSSCDCQLFLCQQLNSKFAHYVGRISLCTWSWLQTA